MTRHFLGVDVGTGSVRAAVFDMSGRMLVAGKRDIALFQDGPDIAEQSSRDIWGAVCAAVRRATGEARLAGADIAGIGFDATCSLAVLGPGGTPLPVGAHGDPDRNVIVWMDHRATAEARRINAAGHRVLDHVGGAVSPEMQTPKLLWLKENLPETYDAAWQFFDLADFLTWRATGSLARSACTVTCKWTYLAHERRWDGSFFEATGLGELAAERFARIGTEIVPAGTALGSGLTEDAAAELGLRPGTPVAAGLIDAHAGGLGSVGAPDALGSAMTRMAYVFGTSACTMASSAEPRFIPGIWGPYRDAMVPGLWLNEGGQSAAGAALDQLVSMHPAAAEVRAEASAQQLPLPAWLAEAAATEAPTLSDAARLADGLHVVPEFLGNRSPFADPDARAVIAGLGMERDRRSLVALYVAGLLGIGYGLRQIVAASRGGGAAVEAIVLSGGAGRHRLVRQLMADCTGLPVLIPREEEPVLLGAAMLGAAASGAFASLEAAMAAMSAVGETFRPAAGVLAGLHGRRFEAFEALQRTARTLRPQHGAPAGRSREGSPSAPAAAPR